MKDGGEEKRQKHLLLKLYLNRSHCFIKLHMPKKACLDLQKVLSMEPRNAKALYRMGRAKRMLGNNSEAEMSVDLLNNCILALTCIFVSTRYLKRAQKLAPNDESIGHELVSLDAQIRKEREAQRILYQKMFPGKANRAEKSRDVRNASISGLEEEFFTELESQMKGRITSTHSSSITFFL